MEHAKAILDEMIEANRDYWPALQKAWQDGEAVKKIGACSRVERGELVGVRKKHRQSFLRKRMEATMSTSYILSLPTG